MNGCLVGIMSIIAMSLTPVIGLTYVITILATNVGIENLEEIYSTRAYYERECNERQNTIVAEKIAQHVTQRMNGTEMFVAVVAPTGTYKIAEYNAKLEWYRRNQDTWFGRFGFVRVPEYLKPIEP